MTALLKICRAIDAVSARIGWLMLWFVLAATIISALNAVVRKALSFSSNAFLEIQWYLFSAVFLLAAGYTLLKDEHVRIDAVSHRWSRRTQVWIDIVGLAVFVLPLCGWVIAISWPIVVQAYQTGEMSSNAGGLIRWPVYALMPAGFTLLALQAVSELVKRIAFLRGEGPDPAAVGRDKRDEELMAEQVRREAGARDATPSHPPSVPRPDASEEGR